MAEDKVSGCGDESLRFMVVVTLVAFALWRGLRRRQ